MKPFFQGKIDNFCAVYAVLNALQILHDITPGKARQLFNETLLRASRDTAAFSAILNHKVDYVALVDEMLAMVRREFPVVVKAPFSKEAEHTEVWKALWHYAAPEAPRTAVFRFCRFGALRPTPMADHWSTAHMMDEGGLRLFDCSLEPEGLYYLRHKALARDVGLRTHEYFLIPPESVRLLSLP